MIILVEDRFRLDIQVVSSLHCLRFQRLSQSEHASALSLLHVRLAIFEQALPDESLAQQELDVFLRPALGRQSL